MVMAPTQSDSDLTAYFDESGTDRQPRSTALTVAGYVSTVSPVPRARRRFLTRHPGFRCAPPWALCCRPLPQAR
jgi:hypothetical protein